jgi:putative ABC transport system substrate-binding protein
VAEANRPADFEEAFAALAKTRTGALLVTSGPTTNAHRNQIIALAAKSRVVALYAHRGLVEAGGLMSYGAAKPSDVPVQQPTQFELVMNLKTAKALGLTISQSLLQRADQVIE